MESQNHKERIQFLAEKLQNGTITESDSEEFDAWYNSYDDSSISVTADDVMKTVKERIYASIEKHTLETVGRDRFLWLGWLKIDAEVTVCAIGEWFYAVYDRTPPDSFKSTHEQLILPGD